MRVRKEIPVDNSNNDASNGRKGRSEGRKRESRYPHVSGEMEFTYVFLLRRFIYTCSLAYYLRHILSFPSIRIERMPEVEQRICTRREHARRQQRNSPFEQVELQTSPLQLEQRCASGTISSLRSSIYDVTRRYTCVAYMRRVCASRVSHTRDLISSIWLAGDICTTYCASSDCTHVESCTPSRPRASS